MTSDWLLAGEALLWMIAIGSIVWFQERRQIKGAGLVLGYAVNLWLIHWPGAALYVLPWYSNLPPDLVEVGFRQASYGMLAFAAGALLLGPAIVGRWLPPRSTSPPRLPRERIEAVYLLWGAFSYAILIPAVGQAATTTAIVVAGWNMLVVGLGLACWRAWNDGRRVALTAWLAAAGALPLVTVVSQGYLGYGTGALLAVLTFVYSFRRWPRGKLVAAGLLCAYAALSFYGSYMRDRSLIRESVWSGDSLSERLDRVLQTVSDLEWFDPLETQHLSRIDDRLNQNVLVGTAIDYLDAGREEFAGGETLWHAAIALVPRILWRDKPVAAGSMDLVSRYTGLWFAEGTSVGVGQVLEFYINFGAVGVLLGFAALGTLLTAFDSMARERLLRGDWPRYALVYMPGLSLLQAGWSLVDITASAGAAAVNVLLVNYLLVRLVRATSPARSLDANARAGERMSAATRE